MSTSACTANFGFGFGGVSDEITYAAALTVAPAPRVTVAAELTGRHLADIGRISEITAPHPLIAGVETVRLSAGDLGMDVVNAGGSFKWNVGGAWLVRASVLMPGHDRRAHVADADDDRHRLRVRPVAACAAPVRSCIRAVRSRSSDASRLRRRSPFSAAPAPCR